MKRIKPVVGDKYPAGRISEILPATGANRSLRVRGACAHCGEGQFECRFSDLKSGRQKSCGCKKKESYKRNNFAMVARMTAEWRLEIFEAGELLGSPEAAAAQCGVTSPMASFAWQAECKRLERLPAEKLRETYDLCQVYGFPRLVTRTGFSVGQLMRICRIWYVRKQAAAEAFAKLADRFRELAPEPSVTGSLLEDMRFYMDEGLADIRRADWAPGRYRGEFTPTELSSGKKRSGYEWIYDILRAMPRDLIEPCFGEAGSRFLLACEQTFENRQLRRSRHLEVLRSEAGAMTPRPKRRTPVKVSIPKPSAPADVVVELISQYAELKLAA